MTQCNVMSRWRLIHANVCHHGNEELLKSQLRFCEDCAKNYFIQNLIEFLNTLMDVHVKNNYRYSKA